MRFYKQHCITFLIFLSIFGRAVGAQIGLKSGLMQYSDSTKVKNSIKWNDLNNWEKFDQTELSLKYYKSDQTFQNNRYFPSNVMPKNYYEIDYRSSSYYVPRMVKDELNLIMNRPKDNSFVPILGVAFLAAQLASKYVFVQEKLKISKENILNTLDEQNILYALWNKYPQTASQLYENSEINIMTQMKELKLKINKLIDNKLIKQKNLEDKEVQLFPAVFQTEYKQILQQIVADSSLDSSQKEKIEKLMKK